MITIPKELQILLDHNKRFQYDNPNRARGLMVGILNDYAGDDMRRRTFTKAVFGVESSHELKDYQIAAFLGWHQHPEARGEVNRIISDYLKEQGQMSLL